jgi:hypothetical protein
MKTTVVLSSSGKYRHNATRNDARQWVAVCGAKSKGFFATYLEPEPPADCPKCLAAEETAR